MKKIITFLISFPIILFSQIGNHIDANRVIDWSIAGLAKDSIVFYQNQIKNINLYYQDKDSLYFDNALKRLLDDNKNLNNLIISFPKGIYKFSKPIVFQRNVVLRGMGSNSTHLEFYLKNERATCITFRGKSSAEVIYRQKIEKGSTSLNNNFKDETKFIHLYQGKDEYGKSSSGKEKQYRKGQIIKAVNKNNKLELESAIRLAYELKDKWGEEIKLRQITPIQNSGIENLSVNRKDKPPKNGGTIITFSNAYNCWIKGVESKIGANYHIAINSSLNCEVSGSYIHDAYSNDGGGNGYGVLISGQTTDCLIEDNIFEGLRHAMIIAGGANGNVFGYNSSFYKPLLNMDEASISVHGHYPYMNLFESNYVEYISVDYVWGANGPGNTFLRNYSYHTGLFGLWRNQELLVERGTNSSNIVANVANVFIGGKNNYVKNNFSINELSGNKFHPEFSYYQKSKPDFINNEYSWPCIGLRVSESGDRVINKIPSMDRFYQQKKTVDFGRVNKQKPIPDKKKILQRD